MGKSIERLLTEKGLKLPPPVDTSFTLDDRGASLLNARKARECLPFHAGDTLYYDKRSLDLTDGHTLRLFLSRRPKGVVEVRASDAFFDQMESSPKIVP